MVARVPMVVLGCCYAVARILVAVASVPGAVAKVLLCGC